MLKSTAGSTRAITDGSGQVVERRAHYTYFYASEAGKWYQQVRSGAEAYAEEQAAEGLVTGVRQGVEARNEE